MRRVAALSLVAVVLIGGVVTGTIITGGGDNLGLSTDDGPEDAADSHGGAQGYSDEPAENLQQNGSQNQTQTPTPTQNQTQTPTPTQTSTGPPRRTRTQTPTPTPTPTPTDDDGGLFDDWDDTPTPSPSPSPTPQETSTPSQSSAQFEVVDATVDSNDVTVGEYVEVTAMVENRGQQAGTYEAQLQVDGQTLATQNVFVEGGQVETVAFQVQFEEPGRYDVAVSDTRAGTVTVSERQMQETGKIEVIDAVVPADVVRPGVETTVRATVENPNDRELSGTLNVTIDGERVAQKEVSLGPGERTEVTIAFEAQEGTVAVNGVEAGDLRVSEDVDENQGAEEAEPNEQAGMDLGYLLLAAAIVIAGAILVAAAVRWRSDDSMIGTLEERRR
jgi:hypothetical protein